MLVLPQFAFIGEVLLVHGAALFLDFAAVLQIISTSVTLKIDLKMDQ